jgi:hypothetical protein
MSMGQSCWHVSDVISNPGIPVRGAGNLLINFLLGVNAGSVIWRNPSECIGNF